MWRKSFAELIGTFALVFVGTGIIVLTGLLGLTAGIAWFLIALAFGLILMVLVTSIGPVSGCHVNPAVTIAMLFGGRIGLRDAFAYIIAQLLGALLASGILYWILRNYPGYSMAGDGLGANGDIAGMGLTSLIVIEILLSAFFIFVILLTTEEDRNPAAMALGIGGALFIAHLISIPLTGTSVNPARSFGPALLMGGTSLKLFFQVFLWAPVIGGGVGLIVYRILRSEPPIEEDEFFDDDF